jgi:agmatinase
MKLVSLLHFLAFAGSSSGCGGHNDEKEWSKEELAELEAKWGHEVSIVSNLYLIINTNRI